MESAASQASDWRTEEVRIAMALNGGVSLAVWMGGCAVELDCARRAHLGPEPLGVDDGGSGSVRSVYAALCLAFDRQLIVDLMSGASAGGINGALLAAAVRSNTRLHPDFLRARWLELGDFGNLLQKTENAEPRSLMQGAYFYNAMLDAFEAVLGDEKADGADLVSLPHNHSGLEPVEAKLEVTTTNVLGTERTYADCWDQKLVAREYRARFKFHEGDDFEAENLAQAARASASFPAAFEPWLVKGEAAKLARFPHPRYAIDGGLLDNAPIKAVLDLIPERPAARQVQRFVCYVNADPPVPEAAPDPEPDEPPLPDVIGYVVNLPRNAPFVDQLAAIEQAIRRGIFANDTERALLALDLDALTATAKHLLPAYRRRRRLISLEELLDDPAAARTVFDRLTAKQELPWVPTKLDPPARSSDWSWGVRAAERVLHLNLDLLREAVSAGGARRNRSELLEARTRIDALLRDLRVRRLEQMRNTLIVGGARRLVTDEDITAELRALDQAMADYDRPSFQSVKSAAKLMFGVSAQLGDLERGLAVGEALFGPAWAEEKDLTDEALKHFLQRVLGVEVVRRAFFADEAIDAGQDLRFAQLTPFAPAPIFSSAPLRDAGPRKPDEKLTGLELGHFAAFYRRSWRVNDFMWGRLDAAARITDMLVSPERAQWLEQSEATLSPAWTVLARELTAQTGETGLWLLHEALVDARLAGPDGVQGALTQYGFQEPPKAGELYPFLEAALKADLSKGGTGSFTRLVCTRAAQLEVARQELPLVADESREDRANGALSAPLGFPEKSGARAAIEEVRRMRGKGQSLPKLLGRTREETASNLAVRTVTHAAFVAVAALRTAKVPLAQVFSVVRAPLLPAAGMVSRNPLNWVAVVLGFSAALSYLAARVLTTSRDPERDAVLSSVFSLSAAVAGLAVVTIAAVALVPLFRAWRGTNAWRKARDFLLAVLLASGGVAAIGIGLWKLDIGWAELVGAPDAVRLDRWVALLVLGAVLGIPIVRGIGLWRSAQSSLNELLLKPWGGYVSLLLIAAASVAILWETAPKVWDFAWNGSWSEWVIAVSAGVSSAVCVAAFLPRAVFGVMRLLEK